MRSLRTSLYTCQTVFRGCPLTSKGSTPHTFTSPWPQSFALLCFQTRHSSNGSTQGNGAPQIKLRPYQEESIQRVLEYLNKGERRLGLSLATGSGKTVIFSHLIDRVPAPIENATQTLILAHRRELIQQAAKHCADLYPSKCVEVEMGSQHATGAADITVASVQSITSGDRLSKYDPDRFKLLLVDEAHHIAANTYLRILEHFNLKQKDATPHTTLVGVSATFERADGLGIGKAIDHIVYHKDYVDMIDDKWLSDVLFTTVQTSADLSKVKTSAGDFQIGALSRAVNNDQDNELTVRSWLAKAEGRKSTLGFCVDKAHVKSLADCFRSHGIDARYVDSDTKKKVREERLDGFKAGEYPVLLNCGIYTEGTDIPNVDCILLARPTKSRSLLVQMIGRGLRLHELKHNCHIIDMVSSLKTGIVTTPTLFGLDPDELVENAGSDELKEAKNRRDERKVNAKVPSSPLSDADNTELSGSISFTDYESIYDLISDRTQERHIRALSSNAWLRMSESKYRLSGLDGSHLTLLNENGLWSLYFYPKIPPGAMSRSPWARPIRMAEKMELEAIVKAAATVTKQDKYKDNFAPWYVARNAPWRRMPATAKQVEFLNNHRGDQEPLSVDDITKGDAMDFITKLRSGAKGQFNKQVAVKKATAKKEEREVKMGPRAKWANN